MKLNGLLILITGAILSGCASTQPNEDNNGILLSEKEQKKYLSKTTPPQQFGYRVFMTPQGMDFLGAARLHPNHRTKEDFIGNRLPIVKMRGRAARMTTAALIDPSMPVSWMELTTAEEFNAQFLGLKDEVFAYRGGYNLGGADAYAAVVTQLRFDQLFMENVPLFVRMAKQSLGALARDIKHPNIGAVIGYDVLRTFEFVQIDFNAQIVRFSASTPYTPSKELLMTKARILNVANFGLAVEGAIFDQSLPIILDFAGDYYFARSDVTEEGLTKQVSIGDIVYRAVPTLPLPEKSSPPRAGKKMLENYIITIANREGVVYFERLPE
jgi:hypothetical protein